MSVVSAVNWQLAAQQHQQVVASWTSGRLHRRSRGLKHPVDDFMFEYYPISVNKLATWHPGWSSQLEPILDFEQLFNLELYVVNQTIGLNTDVFVNRESEISSEIEFLTSTMNRQARTGCFGLHEWAMVLGDATPRHEEWPLRVSQAEIANTISEVGLGCTHFDAFRFFTESARPLNPLQLVRADQPKNEQPGCLHANMDLYKIAMRWAPIVGSLLVRQCFRLARQIRTLDMQSAPYDLKDLGVLPIRVETSEGRSEFAKIQKSFSAKAQLLRGELIRKLSEFSAEYSSNQI